MPRSHFAEGGELASLIRRYFAELEEFSNALPNWLEDDENFLADQPFDVTLRELVGVPAQTADDALWAMEWIIRESNGFGVIGGESLYGREASRSPWLSATISPGGWHDSQAHVTERPAW